MNRTKLKNYAPQARRDFIQAMQDRAAFYGLTEKRIELVVERGDVAVIAGRVHPRSVAKKRKQLEDRIQRHGFKQTMEAMAYTWFNRLAAIRFMELHGYLDHGYRVLSHREGKQTPEVLEHAEYVELPGLKKETIIDLKLAGNKDSELYRLLLTAQCNALHRAMPFLFERIDDETELLLPDNLLHSDSLIRKLVSEIDEEDWQEVEIIGWLYQFYISEKKDEVIGKVVASEDIPAATQLFTPNWIVKYLVQNTLGRQWLATYPQSALRQKMQYFIEPAEQTPEVQQQLKAITPASWNPEELTLLDPACGSGHILVEAYDLFTTIYQERGYRARDIPALILQKNLFGMEIDDRAAQLAAFALMMKARADDRLIFDRKVKPNILAFQESRGINAGDVTRALNSPLNTTTLPRETLFEEIDEEKAGLFSRTVMADKGNVSQEDISALLALFQNAKTFGSLIRVSPTLMAKLPAIERRLEEVLRYGDLAHTLAQVIKPLLQQALFLTKTYDAVVANPPYMGLGFFNSLLKQFVTDNFECGKGDLYSAFMLQNTRLARRHGFVGMITIPNWMSLTGFQAFRATLLDAAHIVSFVQCGRGVWGSDFGSCAFVIQPSNNLNYRGIFKRLFKRQGEVQSNEELEANFLNEKGFRNYIATSSQFRRIQGTPIVFWLTDKALACFDSDRTLARTSKIREGINTGDNARFLRLWYEVDVSKIAFETRHNHFANQKWVPHKKGGSFRRWYGNCEFVLNWWDGGKEIHEFHGLPLTYNGAPMRGKAYFFMESLSWSRVTSGRFSVRRYPEGFSYDSTAPSVFTSSSQLSLVLGLLNSEVVGYLLLALSPTVDYRITNIGYLPLPASSEGLEALIDPPIQECVSISRDDWDCKETSWNFRNQPLLGAAPKGSTVEENWEEWKTQGIARIRRMQHLVTENNRLFIEAYGLNGELQPEVSDEQIGLHRPDREEDTKRLLSYGIGCVMGRYSLDRPALVYANGRNQGFDAGQYKTFRADDSGIIPLLESDWGIRNDATNRVVEFIGIAWPREHLEENLKFIADSLGSTNDEQPRDTIRHYLGAGFYKHHLSMYKKRPIYWLFSSGKQRAFQCLVYLHRYHEGTLARMRTEYVIPLQGQFAARIEQIEGDKAKATSTSHRRKLQKEQDDLKKQQAELLTFEEKLKHAADQKISLDLDDGVKVNYGKFGDLLAEAKAITGGKEEE